MHYKEFFLSLILIFIVLGSSIQAESIDLMNKTNNLSLNDFVTNSNSNDLNTNTTSPGTCVFNALSFTDNITIVDPPKETIKSPLLSAIRGVNNLDKDVLFVFTRINQTRPELTIEVPGKSSEIKQFPSNAFEIFVRIGDTWYKSARILTMVGRQEYEYSISEGTDGKGPFQIANAKAPVLDPKSEEKGHYDYGNASYIPPSSKLTLNSKQNLTKFTSFIDKGNAQLINLNYETALEDYNQALALNNSSEKAWAYKGIVLNFQGKFEESLDAYNNAIGIFPDNPELWLGKGTVENNLGKIQEASDSFNKTLSLDPENREVGHLIPFLGKPELFYYHLVFSDGNNIVMSGMGFKKVK